MRRRVETVRVLGLASWFGAALMGSITGTTMPAAHAQTAKPGAKAPAPAPTPTVPFVLPPIVVPPSDAGQRREWLKTQLDQLFALPTLAGSKVSVLVTDADAGRALYARGEKLSLNAASNVKLVTSAAALALLGAEFRWKTAVYGPARTAGRWLNPGGELPGDLYLRGSGDPTLSTEALSGLASDLASLGVKRVKGALVVDASAFEGGSVGPAFDQKTESAWFRAPSSAASLNSNTVAVTIIPGTKAGAAARVVVEPSSPYFTVTGRVVTAKNGPAVPVVETSAAGDAANPQTRITLSGRVRLGTEPRTLLRRIEHPELFLGHSFKQLLAKRGITVEKPLRLEPVPTEGWRALAVHESPALAVVVQDLNKRSSNFAAEQLVRTLGAEVGGRPGTWDKGLDAIGRYLETLGISRQSYRMANGSGLYDSNRFSAEQMTTVIRGAMRDFRITGEFLASLSVAGADGTLAQRMGGTLAERFVRAKTGTLATVSCLSGIAGAPGQKPLVFAILMNDVPYPLEARAIQDRVAELLVAYLDPSAATALTASSQSAPRR